MYLNVYITMGLQSILSRSKTKIFNIQRRDFNKRIKILTKEFSISTQYKYIYMYLRIYISNIINLISYTFVGK